MNTKKDRTLELLTLLLREHVPLTTEELCRQLSVSQRTLYRYIDAFREAGLWVDKVGGCYTLKVGDTALNRVSNMLYFNREESMLLYDAIDQMEEASQAQRELKRKVKDMYTAPDLKEKIVKLQSEDKVEKLQQAINDHKCVVLSKYSSPNSRSQRDRYVEPFAMESNNKMVWCYEVESHTNKVFLLSRVERVKPQSQSWSFEAQHHRGFVDAFRMISPTGQTLPVLLKLNRRAYTLMIDENPQTAEDIKNTGPEEWTYEARVSSYRGVGRFILGLADNIVVVTPELRRYLRDFATSYLTYPTDTPGSLHKDIIE